MTDVPVSVRSGVNRKTRVCVTHIEVYCRNEETTWNLLLPSAIMA